MRPAVRDGIVSTLVLLALVAFVAVVVLDFSPEVRDLQAALSQPAEGR